MQFDSFRQFYAYDLTQHANPASDWVMWWQMLTGKVPFSGRLASA